MKTAVVSVGREVLTGRTVNTNLKSIALRLREIGVFIKRSVVIDDIKEEYVKILDYLEEDLIIFTGGLGPTVDDITRETVLEYFNCETRIDEDALRTIKGYFDRVNKEMKNTNNKQALMPKNGVLLNNQRGTAPGLFFEKDGKKIVLLPGPPRELEPMLDQVVEILKKEVDSKIISKGFKLVGTGESSMEFALNGFYEQHPNVSIAPYAGSGEIKYVFSSTDEDAIDDAMGAFFVKFNEFIYGTLEDTLEGVVVDMLAQENKKISTVESCTGGLLSGAITSVSGSSKVFDEGFVTYSNEAKMKHVNVSEKTLKKYGAVSEQCAREMAHHLYQKTGSDVTVSITGIAGPTGGSKEKPVGLVYFGITYEGKVSIHKEIFNGDRDYVRKRSVIYALNLVRKELTKMENFY